MEGLKVMALITLCEVGTLLMGLREHIIMEMDRPRETGIEGNTAFVMDLINEFQTTRVRKRRL